jgi:hypothetical protein
MSILPVSFCATPFKPQQHNPSRGKAGIRLVITKGMLEGIHGP